MPPVGVVLLVRATRVLFLALAGLATGGCRSVSPTETATPPTTGGSPDAGIATTTATTTAPPASATPTSGASATPPAGAERAGVPRAACEGLFDPPEGAVRLCNEHVLGDKAEIAWSSWAVTASRWDAFQPYQKRARDCGAGFVTKPPILSISKGDVRLSFHEATDSDYPSCATKPAPSHPTVLVISTKHDR